MLSVDRAGQTLSVDIDSIRSLQYGWGCTDSVHELVGLPGLPIQSISEASAARGALADAGLGNSSTYVVRVDGRPVAAPHLGSDGQLVDDSGDVRKLLEGGTERPFAFTVLSRAPSKAQGCGAWTQITFTLESWEGGIKTGPATFVPYIGGRVVALQGAPSELGGALTNAVRASDTLDAQTFYSIQGLDSQFSHAMEQHGGSMPHEPVITAESFPRHGALQAKLEAAFQSHKLFSLYQGTPIIQRVSSTYVLAGPFYAPAASLGFCDDDVCHYMGPIFVRLRSPSLASNLTPGMPLQYAGVRNYVTVAGAPEAVPEFRQVDLATFPDIRELKASLAEFHPTAEETANYVLPARNEYQKELKAWALSGIELQHRYLQTRLELVRKLTIPLLGARVIQYPSHYGMLPQQISPEMQSSLPVLLKNFEHNVTQLLNEISSAEKAGDAYPFNKAILISEYVRGWITLSSNNLTSLQGDVSHSEGQPWDELQSWTRVPIPMLAADGTPLEPSWWQEFNSLGKR
jgi:hypothetical protein